MRLPKGIINVDLIYMKPVKYWIVAGIETHGWWIFKRERFVAYIHSDLLSYGPFYSMQDALETKRLIEIA